MTTTDYTEAQLTAIEKAIDNREGWESKDPQEVVQLLREEGHEAFVAVADDPLGVGPPPGAEPAPTEEPASDNTEAETEAARKLPTADRHEVASRADLYGGYDDGLDDELDGDDLLVPRLKIKQAQTKDPDGLGISELEDGTLYHSNDAEASGPARTLVLVALSKERVFYGPYGKKRRGDFAKLLDELSTRHGVAIKNRDAVMDGGVICSSRDRVQPRRQARWGGTLGVEDGVDKDGKQLRFCKVLDESGRVVKACPESKWSSRTRNCNETYELAAFDVTDGFPGLPCVYSLSGKAYRLGKPLLTTLKTRRRLKRLPMFGFTVELSTVYEDNEDGKFYLPHFGTPTPMSKEDLDAWLPFYAETAADFARDGEE